MIRPGKMIKEVVSTLFRKAATTEYPYTKAAMPKNFRGRLLFYPERCIGCRLCMRDCPSQAITIEKTGEKQFCAHIDLGKCIYCAQCVDSCLKKALEMTSEFELAKLDYKDLNLTFHVPSAPEESTEE
jgi:formate hydrogenlyase subunit 6/NADH:ubiquinone oxidoreductase subunit I